MGRWLGISHILDLRRAQRNCQGACRHMTGILDMCLASRCPRKELAQRFNTALQELQLLGMIRESSRRRRDHSVQRLIFHMRAF